MTAALRVAAHEGHLVPNCTCDPPDARDTGAEVQCDNCHKAYRIARVPLSERRTVRTCTCLTPQPASWQDRRWCLRCGGDVAGHGGSA